MRVFFVCYGGSGSTFLIRRLSGLALGRPKVHIRPETYFLPDYFPQQKKSATGFDQQLSAEGYADRPTAASVAGFFHRSKYQMSLGLSIDDNLKAYVEFMKAQPRKVTMFSRAPMLGFFSRNGISGGVFVVRHPLHQYISLTKPQRHLEFVEGFGGPDTEGGVRFFAEEWNRFVGDVLGSKNLIVRYEMAGEDAQHSGNQDAIRVFAKWNGGFRNLGKISLKHEELLRSLVHDRFRHVYDSWSV